MLETTCLPDLPMLPSVFRLTSLSVKVIDHKSTQCTATLFHEQASLKVRWTTARADARLKPNQLVSIRWKTTAPRACDDGSIDISRLVLLERPEPMLNLFELIPHGWVRNRELVRQGAELIECLPRGHRHLFNAIFWGGDRFRRFSTCPSSLNGHHNGDNGNLQHAIEVATLMRERCGQKDITNTPLGILTGLLHDAGKADDYRIGKSGQWQMSDRGRLLGHRITNIEWISAAMAKHRISLPRAHYEALLHCLTATRHAPEWLGIRKPAMLEAMLLSDMDRYSGTGDLIGRCAANDGWGKYHPHIGGMPFVVGNAMDGHAA